MQAFILAGLVNRNLEKYRGIYEGRDILIVGGGASLDKFQQINNTVNIGINRAFKIQNIDFDYLFAQDNFPLREDIEAFISYKPETCKKMIGYMTKDAPFRYRQSDYARIKNREMFVINNIEMLECPHDITLEPLADLCGTVFTALQFALLTNPKRIILAGFDCNTGHFFDEDKKLDLSWQLRSWLMFKEHVDRYYEQVEIISLNPINLKGLFNDVYTQSFIEAHPELNNENLRIINKQGEIND